MPVSTESQLNESFRDALVAYYLGEVVPNSMLLKGLGLNQRLKTANDLYEFFLLDSQVGHEVNTSYAGSAISSIQQYINGALMQMEPGYDLLEPTQARFVEWRERSSQYPIWASNMQLALYPEAFISPALRLKKSAYFAQLESDINQNKINIDTTQEAVKAYLASFEEVANLTVINGYIDSDRFAEGKYYFIGKSRAENIYYWRMVDMNERAYLEGTDGPKYDNPTPGAWSDWKRADLGVNACTLERTIRPVFVNNRLFITWVDMIDVTGEPKITETAEKAEATTIDQVKLVFNLSYKKYDDSWSAPQPYMDVITPVEFTQAGNKVNIRNDLNTIASFDISASPESLFIAMYAGEKLVSGDIDGTRSDYAFLHTAFIDKNFNTTRAFPKKGWVYEDYDAENAEQDELRIRKTCWVFALKNKAHFQFTWNLRVAFKTLKSSSPNGTLPDWNYNGWQNRIAATEGNPPLASINQAKGEITFTTDISSNFGEAADPKPLVVDVTFSQPGLCTMHLVIGELSESTGLYHKLEAGSWLSFNEVNWSDPTLWLGFRLDRPMDTPDQFWGFILNQSLDYYVIDLPAPNEQVDLTGGHVTAFLSALVKGETTLDPNGELNGAYLIGGWMGGSKINVDAPGLKLDFKFSQLIAYPVDMNHPYDKGEGLLASDPYEYFHLKPPRPFFRTFAFDKTTLLPVFPATTFISGSRKFFVTHGVRVHQLDPDEWIGRAMKSTEIELHWVSEGGVDLISPKISKRTDPLLGIAEYIDFSASSIQFSDDSTTDKRDPIRMNTLFARELINKANIALEALLSWDTQQLPEPPIGDDTNPSKMDFKGANGLYFWELFLHLPFMISHRLNLEQRFNEAEFWLAFIFDPGRKEKDEVPAYWNVRPLTELPDPDYFMRAPIDPDGIAASDPVRYQKAVYFHYIKNLIDRGDMAYRQLTADSLGEAKLWYVRILDLLGPRPDIRLTSRWTPITLAELAASRNPGLRQFETQLIEQQQQARINGDQPVLRLSTFASDPTLNEEDTDHFIVPLNSELTRYWDLLETRLYNLRHNLTLDGKPMSVSLFSAPLDPRALLAAYANGATEGGAGALLAQETPHYRFAVMINRAHAAVDLLIQFGNTLLSIIERREQGQLLELQQQQAWEFAQYAIDLQLEAQKVEVQARKALEASKAIAEARGRFYSNLADENVSQAEQAAAVAHLQERIFSGVAATAAAVSAGMKVLPNHLGLNIGATLGVASGAEGGVALGGHQLEGIAEVVSIAANATSTVHGSVAVALDRTESFRRRLQEWVNARDQAWLEAEQITAQLAVHDAQTRVTALQVRQAQEAKNQAEVVYAFLNKRFTNSQLYQWLNGQFATFYYQAYDATFSLCLAAQACWQYEIADFSTTFVQPAAWKDAWRGLTAGEALKLNLTRMETAFLNRNERKLEILKTISVRQLPATEDSLNKGWDAVVERLASEGVAEFEVTRAMLDASHPGHYLRRIKRISVSLPVTVGPYQNLRATLTQTWSAVQMNAQADGPLKENMRASQQIAVSTGADDDGLFAFNFDDERYLPFEGTGAISRWTLTFHNPDAQRDVIDSITDIILHMRYTAKSS